MSIFFVLYYALWGKNILLGLFCSCSGRIISVTFFLLEESDCSRLRTLPFPLVFGRDNFRREWYNSTVVWVKIIYLFVIRECYLVLTM